MPACHIVKDLLPNYIDGLVSAETRQEVAGHLQSCGDCLAVYTQMEKSLEAASPQGQDKQIDKQIINFLKKLRAKMRWIKIAAGVLAGLLLAFSVLAWVFAVGGAVSLDDVTITESLILSNEYLSSFPSESGPNWVRQYNLLPGRVNPPTQQWQIQFTLTNGKALRVKREASYSKNANGVEMLTGIVYTLYETPDVRWLNTGDSFTGGYSYEEGGEEPEDCTVTVRLKDKELVYSMREEGLFDVFEGTG